MLHWLYTDLTLCPGPTLHCSPPGSRIPIRLLAGFPLTLAHRRTGDYLLANVIYLSSLTKSYWGNAFHSKAVAAAACVKRSLAVRKFAAESSWLACDFRDTQWSVLSQDHDPEADSFCTIFGNQWIASSCSLLPRGKSQHSDF